MALREETTDKNNKNSFFSGRVFAERQWISNHSSSMILVVIFAGTQFWSPITHRRKMKNKSNHEHNVNGSSQNIFIKRFFSQNYRALVVWQEQFSISCMVLPWLVYKFLMKMAQRNIRIFGDQPNDHHATTDKKNFSSYYYCCSTRKFEIQTFQYTRIISLLKNAPPSKHLHMIVSLFYSSDDKLVQQ